MEAGGSAAKATGADGKAGPRRPKGAIARACQRECYIYTWYGVLSLLICVCLGGGTVLALTLGDTDMEEDPWASRHRIWDAPSDRPGQFDPHGHLWLFGLLYGGLLYLCYMSQIYCCCRANFGELFFRDAVTPEKAEEVLNKPRAKLPRFSWREQSYHMEDREREIMWYDDKGRPFYGTEHYEERVDKDASHRSGDIPSTDGSPVFAFKCDGEVQTEIVTKLKLDFSRSNYHSAFQQWCDSNKKDVLQERSHEEVLPGRVSDLVVVSRPRPWWLTARVYHLADIFCLHACFRCLARAMTGYQEYACHEACGDVALP